MENIDFVSMLPQVEKQKHDDIHKLVEDQKKKPVPLILYGAGFIAREVERDLKRYQLYADACVVDNEYINQEVTTYCQNVMTVSALNQAEDFQEYDLIIAISGKMFRDIDLSQFNKKHIRNIVHVFPYHFMDELTLSYIRQRCNTFNEVYHLLGDELSKKTFLYFMKAILTTDFHWIEEVYKENQYFDNDLIKIDDQEVVVDGGAYNGDTFSEFQKNVGEMGTFKGYYAFEPDKTNFEQLKERVQSFKNVKPYNMGLWSQKDTLYFTQQADTSSNIMLSNEETEENIVAIEVDCIDHLCPDATFIKLDVEGVELEALQGAEETIKRNKPKVAVCIYHNPQHLTDIMLYMKQLVPEYSFYVRQHMKSIPLELVLYCIYK